MNTLEVIRTLCPVFEDNYGKKEQYLADRKIESLVKEERLNKAAHLLPVLRGLLFINNPKTLRRRRWGMIGHFTDDDRVLQYINSNDLERLAPLGTSCPDHFLRTKISPLVLILKPGDDLGDILAIKEKLNPQFEEYRKMYADYYEKCKSCK
jgi:rhamnose utilization protein RhaD (predicted bifunctional aldolase and dehydrogenase)